MINRLLDHLRTIAPQQVDIPVLQPADPFLETAGEDLRRRIFISQSIDGKTLCLRPEFTIPICLSHVENGGGPARYSYGGAVFRQARQGTSEFLQAGIEDIGEKDRARADAGSIASMVRCLNVADVQDVSVTLGDQALFGVVVESLELPDAIAKRFVRSFGSPRQIELLIEQVSSQKGEFDIEKEVDRLAFDGDEEALIAHIETLMAAGNLAPQSGRSPADIAKRMISKTQESRFQLEAGQAETLRTFLALDVPLTQAVEALASFARSTGIDFAAAGRDFESRIAQLDELGIDAGAIRYKASLGRNLEYYTGVVFEAVSNGVTIAGGGRYDQLCSLLGAADAIPAVGFSISLDRVEEAKCRS